MKAMTHSFTESDSRTVCFTVCFTLLFEVAPLKYAKKAQITRAPPLSCVTSILQHTFPRPLLRKRAMAPGVKQAQMAARNCTTCASTLILPSVSSRHLHLLPFPEPARSVLSLRRLVSMDGQHQSNVKADGICPPTSLTAADSECLGLKRRAL